MYLQLSCPTWGKRVAGNKHYSPCSRTLRSGTRPAGRGKVGTVPLILRSIFVIGLYFDTWLAWYLKAGTFQGRLLDGGLSDAELP